MNNHENCESGCTVEHGAPIGSQAFAPPPAPPGPVAGEPAWSLPVPPRPPRRGGRAAGLLIGAGALVAATALITSTVSNGSLPARADDTASEQPAAEGAPAEEEEAAGAPAQAPTGAGSDLRQGAVFLQSNNAGANEVVAFSRDDNGKLTEAGRFPTGGTGTGSFEDSAGGIVLGTSDGETSPTKNVDDAELLFVTNAGSGTVTVFRVRADTLELVSTVPSGGNRPVSLTVSKGRLYVLNSGELDRRLLLADGGALENCAHGGGPSVSGFTVTPAGELAPIAKSTRPLSGKAESGCAQVQFTPDGETLVISERVASMQEGKAGTFVTYDVRDDGTLGERKMTAPAGNGPFGFTFTEKGQLLSTEQNGGFTNPGGGGAAAYTVTDGELKPVNGTVGNFQTDTCWIVLADDQRYAFASSPFEGGGISSYTVDGNGALTLAHSAATAPDGADVINDVVSQGVTDLGLSQDSRFLYQLNSFEGLLYSFRVEPDGLLTHLGTTKVFDLPPFGAGGQAAPFGLAAR